MPIYNTYTACPKRPPSMRHTLLRIPIIALFVCSVLGCGAPPAATGSPPPPTCTPTDQDAYVYRPARLQVVKPCLRVTGTLVALSLEADGDFHIRVRPDASDQAVLTAGNQEEDGNL